MRARIVGGMRTLLTSARPLVAVLALSALVAVGCGGAGADKNDYVKSLNKAQAALQKSLSGLGADIGAAGVGPKLATKLEASGDAMEACPYGQSLPLRGIRPAPRASWPV
jgi:hypothetical protein